MSVCMKMITIWVNKCKGSSDDAPGVDEVAQEAAEAAADEVAAAGRAGLLAQQQSMANLGTPTAA